jgi:hypothetical protein
MSAEETTVIPFPNLDTYYDSRNVILHTYTHRFRRAPSKWNLPAQTDEKNAGYDRALVDDVVRAFSPLARVMYEKFSPTLKDSDTPILQERAWDCGNEMFLALRSLTNVSESSGDDAWQGWQFGWILYHPFSRARAEELAARLKECIRPVPGNDPKIFVLAMEHGSFAAKEKTIKDVGDMDLALHYGERFLPFHVELLERTQKVTKGVTLFHGPPGTGKTHYIRYLIAALRGSGRSIMLIPSGFASQLSDPSFLAFFLEWGSEQRKGTVLLIEDAEEALESRGGRSTAVSNLLNLTDGLMNDLTKVSVIATVNVDIGKLDAAMTRNGRLAGIWHFTDLSPEEATALARHIEPDDRTSHDFTCRTTVADVYAAVQQMASIRAKEASSSSKPIGFA